MPWPHGAPQPRAGRRPGGRGRGEQPSAAALAKASEIVFLCVTGSPQVEAAIVGPDGLLAGAAKDAGLVIVDCSTSEPDSTARLREVCAAAGVTLVDAPLARTPVEAEAGKLNVMVGAEPAPSSASSRCCARSPRTCSTSAGRAPGTRSSCSTTSSPRRSAPRPPRPSRSAQRAGIDLRQLVALISVGAVNSGLFQMMSKTLDGEMGALRFELDNARKDIRYYTHLAEGLAVPTLIGEAVHQSLALASALGHGRKFVPSLVEAQEQITGATIVSRRT